MDPTKTFPGPILLQRALILERKMSHPGLVLQWMPGSVSFSRRCISLKDASFVGRATEIQPKSLTNSYFASKVVSHAHGMFFYRDGRFYYKDNNSLNGSYINNVKLEQNKEKMLVDGDIIQLGSDIGEDDQTKVLAKILLSYPHVDESLIPDSYGLPEPDLDHTADLEELIEMLEKNRQKTPYEETSIKKMRLAIEKSRELGITEKEALQMVGY